MKKLLLSLGLVLVASVAFGQASKRWVSQSFFPSDVLTLCVSNTLGVTNLASYGVITTNVTGVTWTNAAHTRKIHAGDGSILSTKNLLADCDLGTLDHYLLPIGDTATAAATNFSFCSIYIRLVAESGANTACTFIFYPVFSDLDDTDFESDVAGGKISIAVTSAGTTPVNSVTRVPAYQVWGAKKLRLYSITHPDADATSRVSVTECRLTGYQQ